MHITLRYWNLGPEHQTKEKFEVVVSGLRKGKMMRIKKFFYKSIVSNALISTKLKGWLNLWHIEY